MSHRSAPGRGNIGDSVDLLLQRKFLLRQTAELCLLPAQLLPASTCRPPLFMLLQEFVKVVTCICQSCYVYFSKLAHIFFKVAHVFVKIRNYCSKLSLLLAFNILPSAKENYV